MSFSRPIQWYHSLADPIWPDSTFKLALLFTKMCPFTSQIKATRVF